MSVYWKCDGRVTWEHPASHLHMLTKTFWGFNSAVAPVYHYHLLTSDVGLDRQDVRTRQVEEWKIPVSGG